MRLRRQLLTALLLAGAVPCRAGSAGAEPFNFLFLDAGARAVAMGGAYTALADGGSALLYNPAGLAKSNEHRLLLMHNEHFLGINQEYLGFASRRGWGINVNYLDFGDVQRTTISSPDGSGLGNTGLTDLAVGAGYGRSLDEVLHAGAAVKVMRETIDGVSAQGYALDLGVIYDVLALPDLSLGLSLQNIGPNVTFQKEKESLPLNLRMGAVYTFLALAKENTVSFDLTKARTDGVLIGLGVESRLTPRLPLRLGFNTRNDAGMGITAGIGWAYRNMIFDYAFVPFGVLGSAHRLSVAVRWGGPINDPEIIRLQRLRAGEVAAEREAAGVPKDAPEPETAADHLDNAGYFIAEGEYAKARRSLDWAAAMLKPRDRRRVRYHERLGFISYKENLISEAKSHYNKALKMAIKLGIGGTPAADAYAGIGLCYMKEVNYEQAAKFFKKALKIGPSSETRRLIDGQLKEIKRRKLW